MLIRLLGPVDVLADDGPRHVRGLRRKAVLATLALHGGEVVSAGRLAEVVWGEDAPPTVVNTLQTHVSYLRTVLGSKNAIRACRPGRSCLAVMPFRWQESVHDNPNSAPRNSHDQPVCRR